MLKNKTILVTGASSGIGYALATQFAKAGANLLLCARQFDKIKTLADTLCATHGIQAHAFLLDVTDRLAVDAAISTLLQRDVAIDILVNNAGLAAGLSALPTGEIADWEVMIDTNVKGLLYVTRAILPAMIARRAGHIVNIGSIAGHAVYPNGAVYCATKAAVNVLSQGLRMDLLGKNIRVSTIDPGMVETNFSMVRFKGDREKAQAVYQGMTPLSADDIADAVLYCVTRPSHVNVSEVIIMPTDQASATLVHRAPQ